MSKLELSILFVFITLLEFVGYAQIKEAKTADYVQKPNIIYILADDLGYGDIGVYGQTKIKTPNLDKMANEGIRFTDHYSGQTVCSPSRASLMTGKHMGYASVTRNGQLLDPDDTTIAELIKPIGYKTAIIGKWGLSEGTISNNSPNQQGFDHYFGFENQGVAHFYYPEYLWRNHTKVEYPENLGIRDENGYYLEGKGTYSHDEFAREALQFIEENKDTPFFLYLPYAIPHAEMTVPEDSKTQYRGLNWPEQTKPEGGGGSMPDAGYGSQYTGGYCATFEPNITYAGMISRMDKDIGRIFDLLDKLDLAENTIVMFASDNGPSDEGGQSMEFFNSSAGLRGHKRDLYEGGIRIPFIVKWKGTISEGVESDLPSAFWDILPTVCELTGVNTPQDVNGISLLPTLLGYNDQQKEHNYLYWNWQRGKSPYYEALRVDKWKVFKISPVDKNVSPYYELYDLSIDIKETNNIAQKHPELIEEFKVYFDEANPNN